MIYQCPPTSPDAEPLVCVIDDDESGRLFLERLFRSARLAVATFASGAEYLERRGHPGPVCLVLNTPGPGLDALDLQAALVNDSEQLVFLTGNGDVQMCVKAMKAGAVDFLTKPVSDEVILAAVKRALANASELSTSHADRAAAKAIIDSLTKREFEVMERVVAGRLNKQIAAELGIAEKTVKIHRGRLMRKTNSVSVPDLMRLVINAEEAKRPWRFT